MKIKCGQMGQSGSQSGMTGNLKRYILDTLHVAETTTKEKSLFGLTVWVFDPSQREVMETGA